MAKIKKKPGLLAKGLLETAAGLRKSGLLDRAAYGKITLRHLGQHEAKPLNEEAEEIIKEEKVEG